MRKSIVILLILVLVMSIGIGALNTFDLSLVGLLADGPVLPPAPPVWPPDENNSNLQTADVPFSCWGAM